jgi:hypothetical protein
MKLHKGLVLLATITTLGGGVAAAAPASAQSNRAAASVRTQSAHRITAAASHRVDACFSGACGSATYTKTSAYTYRPVNMSVRDNKCDGHPSYIQAFVEDGSPSLHGLTKHYNHLGCHGGYASWSSYINWSAPITAVAFKICVDDWGSDTCKWAV